MESSNHLSYMKDEDDNKCEVCPLPAEKSCSACYTVSYCSVEHQKLDWKNHKKLCNAYKVEMTEELGLHLVASRDLKSGTLVLKERPISIGPKVRNSTVGDDVVLPFPLCLGCYAIMTTSKDDSRKCSKCKWPVCSVSCEKMSYHANNECAHFVKNNVKYSGCDYNSILILRTCLMTHKDLSMRSSVLKLQHELPLGLGRDKHSIQNTKERAKKLIDIFKISDKVSIDDWIRISNAADINAFEVYVMEFAKNGQTPRTRMGSILTLKASMLSHSCSPNCSWSVSVPAGDMTIQVRTAVDVVKGEVLTITYKPEFNTLGTIKRRKAIKHFLCKCTRCVDPTELGSNFSTMVCPKCKTPALLSTNPLDESSPWQCSSCMFVEMDGLRKITDLILEFQNFKDKDPRKIQSLISKHSGIDLHKNHWLLMKAIKDLMQSLDESRRFQDLLKQQKQLYISSAEHLLRLTNIITPGISKERAHLQKTVSKEILNHAMYEYSQKNLSLVEFQKQIKQVEDLQEEAYKFFKTDCEEAENGKKSDWVAYLDEQIKLVKYVYRGSFTVGSN